MKQTALWRIDAEASLYPSLGQDIETDVAIIGGGITGITLGLLLARAGKSVCVLEAGQVAGGTSGYSTGNLYATINEELHTIASKFSKETAATVASSRKAAVDQIEQFIGQFDIDCGFQRVPWYLIAESKENDQSIQKEYQACVDAGLQAYRENFVPLPVPVYSALRVEHQAQINPLQYVKALAAAARRAGCQVYEDSKVIGIDTGKPNVLHTSAAKVKAAHIVHATHMPKGFMLLQTLLGPYREYAVAVKIRGDYPKGIFWLKQGNHHYSMRSYTSREGGNYLLVLGEPHKVGQKENNQECTQKLEAYVRKHFDVESVEYVWGAQHYKAADSLPYIGAVNEGKGVYVATGFSTDGLVYGTLAAMLISNDILGLDNPWAKVYDPGRHNPVQSAGKFVKENLNVVVQYFKDLPFVGEADTLSDIAAGEGKTIEVDGHKYAAYRDDSGKVHMVSAICTHLKCTVHWNTLEKSWDCPCHGSRFTPYGNVIEGPAISDLPKMEEKMGDG